MKVIFLDVDGVLNDSSTDDRSPNGFIGLSSIMINNLKTVVDTTGACVVLTSTWKSEWDKNADNRKVDGAYLHDTLLSHGICISDKTEDQVSNRGFGIISYLKEHPEIDKWVVLDDDVFFDYKELGIMDHLVRTRFGFGGLTTELAKLVIAKLDE